MEFVIRVDVNHIRHEMYCELDEIILSHPNIELAEVPALVTKIMHSSEFNEKTDTIQLITHIPPLNTPQREPGWQTLHSDPGPALSPLALPRYEKIQRQAQQPEGE